MKNRAEVDFANVTDILNGKARQIPRYIRRLAATSALIILAACGPTPPASDSSSQPSGNADQGSRTKSGQMFNTDPSQCNDQFSSATLEQRNCNPTIVQTAIAYEKTQYDLVATVTADQEK